MDTTGVRDLVLKLDNKWFNQKKLFFLKEGLYNKDYGKVYDTISYNELIEDVEGNFMEETTEIVLDIELPEYCWSGYFYGCAEEQFIRSENDYLTHNLPINGEELVDDILQVIYSSIDKFTDAKAINIVIEMAISTIKKSIHELLSIAVDEEYKVVLNNFLDKSSNKIHQKFIHIDQQILLLDSNQTFERKMNKEVCLKIANFKIKNKKLITSVSGGCSIEDALFYLFNSNAEKICNVKLTIEDWLNKDVYYLISKLSDTITDNFYIAEIERKKVLHLKTGKLFERNSYDNFKSQKLEIYKTADPNRSLIDIQLATLF